MDLNHRPPGPEPGSRWTLEPCRCRTYVPRPLQNPPSIVTHVPHGLTATTKRVEGRASALVPGYSGRHKQSSYAALARERCHSRRTSYDNGYSLPIFLRTLSSACCMICLFSTLVKSVDGSFVKVPGHSAFAAVVTADRPPWTITSWFAMVQSKRVGVFAVRQ
jgi:hypothetical protein